MVIDDGLLAYLDRQLKWYKAERDALRAQLVDAEHERKSVLETLRSAGYGVTDVMSGVAALRNRCLEAERERDELRARLAETMAAMRANGRGEG